MRPRALTIHVLIGLLVLLPAATAWAQTPMLFKAGKKPAGAKTAQDLSLPEPMDAEDVDHIVAGLSDEQVRRLLINELRAQVAREAQTAGAQPKPSGIAGFIDKIKSLTSLLQTRIEYLRSGSRAAPEQISGIYDFLGRGKRGTKTVADVILSVGGVLAAALLIEWLFVAYMAATRRRITATNPDGWSGKIGVLAMRSLLDFVAIVVFIVAALALFFIFLERTAGQRVLLSTYLAAFVIIQAAFMMSRFFLAPRAPWLRFLPFGDETSLYLHRWLVVLAAVISFSALTSGVMGLAGASELLTLGAGMLGGTLTAAMIIWMILQKRKAVAAELSRGLPESSLRYRLAQKWHHYAVTAMILLFFLALGNRILGFGSGRAILTLLMVPLYFLLDWILRLILDAAFGVVEDNRTPLEPVEVPPAESASGNLSETDSAGVDKSAEEKAASAVGLDLDRVKHPLRAALRLALACLLFFWTLEIWGISLPIGERVIGTVLQILVVVLVCYVAWGLVNAAILRRMRQEVPGDESDDEKEEGGAGGSRIGTLLLLLRKFMLVVILVMAVLIILSALGVNIGPLIAGAGVFGLAIGFGAQTLVKDIISGVFFLMDDAFRVGDYLECSGTKGMVEHISLRSLRLRNPRGMVNFIPFGDIKMVTNLSRDYVIMKLDFRMRYDADVEKIRKIIKKKVYKKIAADPELGPKLLEPIKSQGVREMDDSAMIMRVKYKTKPGDQFAIRKEVYRLMQEAFKEEGIEFAHRNVTVYIPPEAGSQAGAEPTGEGPADGDQADSNARRQAAAAAALAAIQAEEDEQAKKTPKK